MSNYNELLIAAMDSFDLSRSDAAKAMGVSTSTVDGYTTKNESRFSPLPKIRIKALLGSIKPVTPDQVERLHNLQSKVGI